MFDKGNCVIHRSFVTTTTRDFLRSFASYKVRARRGETIRVQEGDCEYLFTATVSRDSLLGCAKGRIDYRDDLSGPTLKDGEWRPSL